MDSATAERLLALNRRFYAERGMDFSETRLRVQPGVKRFVERLQGDEHILDLGCGNGALAAELSSRGHHGLYLGIDQSTPQLAHARGQRYRFPVEFLDGDLVDIAQMEPHRSRGTQSQHAASLGHEFIRAVQDIPDGAWSVITAFAVLHHLPGTTLRISLLRRIRRWIRADGAFVHSNWQFTGNNRLRLRIRPWHEAGPSLRPEDGDYLLDWRRGGKSYRYVHEFREDELAALAAQSGFDVVETFQSDGVDRRSGLYQVWRPS